MYCPPYCNTKVEELNKQKQKLAEDLEAANKRFTDENRDKLALEKVCISVNCVVLFRKYILLEQEES